jgi:hypothetical protein
MTLRKQQISSIVKRVKRIQKSLIRKQANLEEALNKLTSILSYTQIANILTKIHEYKLNQ